ncbi:hypothetical protein WR25_19461 [Diploscapter pachys]|uniref:Cytochrome P450 n=1 Tax=Diploscapter pachys TaxID=2018661 RepID=A0A2A2KLH2_9BILA|nr:hypothetical protein WR25_19461 [Diploscapter pachys]
MIYLLVLAVAFIAYYVKSYYDDVKRYPKGPAPLPIVGNLFSFEGDMNTQFHEIISELSKKYGPVFTIYLPRPYVVICDYHLMKEALVTRGEDFAGRSGMIPDKTVFDADNGGVLFSWGNIWRENRRASLHILRNFGMNNSLMEEQVLISIEDCLRHVDSLYAQSNEIDLRWPIQLYVGNVINKTFFGYHYSYEKCDRYVELAKKSNLMIDVISENINWMMLAQQYPFLAKLPYIGYKAGKVYEDAFKPLIEHIAEDISNSLKSYDSNGEPECFVHAYQRLIDKGSTEEINQKEMQNVVVDFFLAGTETTSTTLRWAMLYMAKYQEVQDKVRKEIYDAYGTDKLPTTDHKLQMPYTVATIHEIQRFCNLANINIVHRTTKDTQVGKKAVEQCIPFSLGKRACAGEGLARLELFIGLTSILQRYKIEPLPGKTVDIEPIGGGGAMLMPKQQKLKFTKLV